MPVFVSNKKGPWWYKLRNHINLLRYSTLSKTRFPLLSASSSCWTTSQVGYDLRHRGSHLVFFLVVLDRDWPITLQWRHNEHSGVSNYHPYDCLLNRLFRHRWKKTSKLRVTGLLRGIHRWPMNSPHKWPVTRKMFPFDDVVMAILGNCYFRRPFINMTCVTNRQKSNFP